jgi:hypothetical protein
MADDRAPLRRWFQFRLSTWFVLVAILAWAMWLRPWAYLQVYDNPTVLLNLGGWPGSDHPDYFQISLQSAHARSMRGIALGIGPNPAILYPALALAAFIGWKTAWPIVERRRKRAEISPE